VLPSVSFSALRVQNLACAYIECTCLPSYLSSQFSELGYEHAAAFLSQLVRFIKQKKLKDSPATQYCFHTSNSEEGDDSETQVSHSVYILTKATYLQTLFYYKSK
jgi:hypothetical protein